MEAEGEAAAALSACAEAHPQSALIGERNLWIVKPGGKSRGRGIFLSARHEEIADVTGDEGQWVAQKYIENPLLVHGRKFDLRQWVLVTSWQPLGVWLYLDR